MSNLDLINRTKVPLTVTTLAEQLAKCGLAKGQSVIVHMALSKME